MKDGGESEALELTSSFRLPPSSLISFEARPCQPPATSMRERNLSCLSPHGFHRVNYYEWGDPENPKVVICVHGVTRNGRDFDDIARALLPDYRVLCPDVVGRGKSEWLTHKEDYGYPLYCSDTAALIARSGAQQVDWVGTSMGGLIGMFLAAQRVLRRIRTVHPRRVGAFRAAHRCAVAAPGADQCATVRRRPLGPELRSSVGAGLSRHPGRRGAVAVLGPGALPDAGSARRRFGPPARGDGAGHDPARPEGEARRVRRHRPRADADGTGPDHLCPGISSRTRLIVAPAAPSAVFRPSATPA